MAEHRKARDACGGFIRIGALMLASLLIGAASFTAAAADKPILDYLYGWGEPGTGTAKFRAIRGIVAYDREAIDRTIVVVADGGKDLVRAYTWDMMFIDKWGGPGTQLGEFHEPRGVAVDKAGNLVITDSANHRVQKTAIGTTSFLQRPGEPILAFGKRGKGDGEFETPTGIEVDAAGNILVVDTGNHRVQKFDAQGKFLTAWGSRGNGKGEFFLPSHIATDSGGRIYVSDSGNNRIQVFDAQGKYVSSIGTVGSKPGNLAEPKGIALDAENNLWVVDRRNHRLQKFGPNGEFLGNFGQQGPAKGEFSFPEDLTFDSTGRLYVTDGMNGRIQVFKPT